MLCEGSYRFSHKMSTDFPCGTVVPGRWYSRRTSVSLTAAPSGDSMREVMFPNGTIGIVQGANLYSYEENILV